MQPLLFLEQFWNRTEQRTQSGKKVYCELLNCGTNALLLSNGWDAIPNIHTIDRYKNNIKLNNNDDDETNIEWKTIIKWIQETSKQWTKI